MTTPKPHDPRTTAMSPAKLTQEFEDILSEPVTTLSEEVDVLDRAHAVLHDALQDHY